ncbi:MAG TPA: hypothetical protein VH277_02145 [Gemmatimonadaceae bacterium]|jgi:hypothetical protein|nr:hypothetical protein [Gemmatimonadaceae bacterium]
MMRDKYRDNDDVRAPLESADRTGDSPDTKSEARGDARENIGNHSRGTAADPAGAEGNDKFRNKENARDQFDKTLESDN